MKKLLLVGFGEKSDQLLSAWLKRELKLKDDDIASARDESTCLKILDDQPVAVILMAYRFDRTGRTDAIALAAAICEMWGDHRTWSAPRILVLGSNNDPGQEIECESNGLQFAPAFAFAEIVRKLRQLFFARERGDEGPSLFIRHCRATRGRAYCDDSEIVAAIELRSGRNVRPLKLFLSDRLVFDLLARLKYWTTLGDLSYMLQTDTWYAEHAGKQRSFSVPSIKMSLCRIRRALRAEASTPCFLSAGRALLEYREGRSALYRLGCQVRVVHEY